MTLLFMCLKIFVARLIDVSLGTFRTINTVKGKNFVASLIGMVEITVWFLVVKEALNTDNNSYWIVFSYALGFSVGTYIGGIIAITRLIYKITKNIGVPNKKFESWLSKSSTLLFISLFIAIFAFIAVDQKIIRLSNQSAEVLRDQKVSVIYNEEQYVIEGLPDKVDVR